MSCAHRATGRRRRRDEEDALDYRMLGRSGMHVSRLCLGTMMFGGQADAATSRRLIDRAADGGVNFIDTADVYNAGRSEAIVGEAIAGRRNHWVLATKLANVMGEGRNQRGLSRRWIFEAVDASLRRLGVEAIDLLYLHREDHDTPMEVTVAAVGDLIKGGKVRTFGVSNFRAWRIAAMCGLCDAMGVDRPVASQPYYNAMNRMPEVELLPAAAHFGLGSVPYSPLGRGVLTGKYKPDDLPPEESRAGRGDKRMMESEWRRESLVIAQEIAAHARAAGITPGQFALNWVLNNDLVTGTIAGPRTAEHLEDYLGAMAYRFTADDEALVDRLVAAGHPSTPGYSDPQYPLEGRVPLVG